VEEWSLSVFIRELHPELTKPDFAAGVVSLQDNSDGTGAFIREWNHSEAMHSDLQSYFKPTA
jgi:hypothetical protein